MTEVDEVERIGRMLPVPFIMFRPDGMSVWCNDAYCDLVGLSFAQVQRRALAAAVHPDDTAACDDAVARALAGESVDVQLRTLHADGHWLHVRWGFGSDPPSGLVAGVALNVTDDQAQTQFLRHEASHDSLTGLVNRAEVLRRLKELAHDPQGVTVAIVDLDRFKMINDRLGHGIGDAALQAMADRLRGLVPDTATVGRLGGDEFIVLQPGRGQAVIEDLAGRLSAASGPVSVEGRHLWLRCTVGVTDGRAGHLDPSAARADPDELLLQADRALFTAKQDGRGRVRIYDDELWIADRHRRRMEARVVAALRDGGLDVYLQPIVTAVDRHIIGLEALARISVDGEVLEADAFMHVVADLGLSGEVSARVRDQAFAVMATLPEDIALYVNLDAEDLLQPGALEELLRTAEAQGVQAQRLVLELTEVLLLQDIVLAAPQLAVAAERGSRIAIDDFGVGTSSLAQISAVPVDVLKVDRSFVTAARRDDRARSVLRAIRALGLALRVQVVIEGVEDEADVELARALGADALQGYHVGRPMSPAALRRLLADRSG